MVFLIFYHSRRRDSNPEGVHGVKKLCRWHSFSRGVRSSCAARTDDARRSRCGIIPPSAPRKPVHLWMDRFFYTHFERKNRVPKTMSGCKNSRTELARKKAGIPEMDSCLFCTAPFSTEGSRSVLWL